MHISSRPVAKHGRAVSTVLGLLLVGIAATPAHAETIREQQWHLDAMKADEMWKSSTGKGITVAVIDCGVDDPLTDLRGQMVPGLDLSKKPGDENTDAEGHGSGIASIIAGTGNAQAGRAHLASLPV